MNAKLLPGKGASSKIEPLSISVDTISNLQFTPLIVLLNPKAGTVVFVLFNLYCSVGILLTVSFLTGLPTFPLTGSAEFKILVNCSDQSGLLGSFHIIVWFSKFKLFESLILSVVCTLSIYNNPFAD